METKITVVDSIMGSGKTSCAIQMINDNVNGKYIYITPYLREVERIKECCKSKRFVDPVNKGYGKLDSFEQLIKNERNIVATHSLFRGVSDEIMELIRLGEYTLVLDEVMDVVEQLHLKRDDLQNLIDLDLICISNDDGLITWNEEKLDNDSEYNKIKQMCKNKSLFMVNKAILMWTFPIEVFKAFNNVYVLTYMFNGQIQRYYYDLFNIKYEYKSAIYNDTNSKFEICDYVGKGDVSKIKPLINIVPDEDKMNRIGDDRYALSKSWFEKNELLTDILNKNLYNFFYNKCKSKTKDSMWSTFKTYRSKLAGKGYTKGFVSLGTRATNEYIDKKNLAFCANTFLNPIVANFFHNKSVKVQEDDYALSEMLQWIWRSQIRRCEEITVYIPSKRMRYLLYDWLEQDENR